MRAKGSSASSVQSKQIIKVWGRQKKSKVLKHFSASKRSTRVFSGSADTCLLRHSPGESSGSIYPSIFKPGCSDRGGTKPWGRAGTSPLPQLQRGSHHPQAHFPKSEPNPWTSLAPGRGWEILECQVPPGHGVSPWQGWARCPHPSTPPRSAHQLVQINPHLCALFTGGCLLCCRN